MYYFTLPDEFYVYVIPMEELSTGGIGSIKKEKKKAEILSNQMKHSSISYRN